MPLERPQILTNGTGHTKKSCNTGSAVLKQKFPQGEFTQNDNLCAKADTYLQHHAHDHRLYTCHFY